MAGSCPLLLAACFLSRDLAAHDLGAFDHRAHFSECDLARKIFEAAIRRHHDPIGRGKRQRLTVSRASTVRSERSITPRMIVFDGNCCKTERSSLGCAASIET